MKTKEIIYRIILVSGIIPATLLLFFSIYAIFIFSITGITDDKGFLDLLLSPILGICGYIGLVRALVFKTKPLLTVLLLVLGLIGISIIGGKTFWIWALTFSEPDEWLIGGYPMFVTIFTIIVNSYRFLKLHI